MGNPNGEGRERPAITPGPTSRALSAALVLVLTATACAPVATDSTAAPGLSTISVASAPGGEGSTSVGADAGGRGSNTPVLTTTTAMEGVASADPEEWLAEIERLRTSAGPGRIVGFVNLAGETSSGAPASPSQPVCVGAGAFSDIEPGTEVIIYELDGTPVGETILRGSAFDGHTGCALWFGVDVPTDAPGHVVRIGDHESPEIDSATLGEFGWILNFWSSQNSMIANCIELEAESEPMTCILLD